MIYKNTKIVFYLQKNNYLNCGGIFDKENIKNEILSLQKKSTSPNFWDNNNYAQIILKKISFFENELKMWDDLESHFNETEFYLELLEEDEAVEKEALLSLNAFKKAIEKVEVYNMIGELLLEN